MTRIDALTEILAGGLSSRFYERIVRDKQLAVSVQAFAPNSRGPRFFGIEATPTQSASLDELERAVYAEIDALKAGPIAAVEIEKARNNARRGFMQTMANSLSLARNLAEYTLYYGSPARINTRWDDVEKLNAADVQRVARQYLTPENRTVVISHPRPAAAGRVGAQ
jgi:zinc protease